MSPVPHVNHSRQLRAEINYILAGAPLTYDQTHDGRGDEELANRLDRQQLTITDARPLDLSLMKHGFALQQTGFDFADFLDDQAIVAGFYPEVLTLLIRQSGATQGLIFDHTLRSQTDYGAGTSRRAPVKTVHSDYNPASAKHRLAKELATRDWQHLDGHRYAFINLWMPLFHPVSDSPLALGDAQTFSDNDYHRLLLRYPDRQGEISALSFNPAHRWYYFPDMTPDEALLFKVYDSDSHQPVRQVPHTAFHNPAADPQAPPRASLELRSILFFE